MLAFEKLWTDAGAPPGIYTNLFISHAQVNQVIGDPRVKGVALTGSVESGYGRELSSLGIQEFMNKKLSRISPIDAPG